MQIIESAQRGPSLKIAIVVSAYNEFVTDRLLTGALETLHAAEVREESVTVVRVPGAFELPLAARLAAESGHYDAIICLGCVIRGETPHFEFIAAAVAHGLTAAAAETGIPMTFGVLTTNSVEEALARASKGSDNKGSEAATAAIGMATIAAQLPKANPVGR